MNTSGSSRNESRADAASEPFAAIVEEDETDDKPADGESSIERPDSHDDTEFEHRAKQRPIGLAAEFWEFLRYSKKWWLLPIVVALMLLSLLAFLTAAGGGPFIYPGV